MLWICSMETRKSDLLFQKNRRKKWALAYFWRTDRWLRSINVVDVARASWSLGHKPDARCSRKRYRFVKGYKIRKKLTSTVIFNSPSSGGYVWLTLADGLCEDNLTLFCNILNFSENFCAKWSWRSLIRTFLINLLRVISFRVSENSWR